MIGYLKSLFGRKSVVDVDMAQLENRYFATEKPYFAVKVKTFHLPDLLRYKWNLEGPEIGTLTQADAFGRFVNNAISKTFRSWAGETGQRHVSSLRSIARSDFHQMHRGNKKGVSLVIAPGYGGLWGLSFCNEDDKFSKKYGRAVAASRLVDNLVFQGKARNQVERRPVTLHGDELRFWKSASEMAGLDLRHEIKLMEEDLGYKKGADNGR